MSELKTIEQRAIHPEDYNMLVDLGMVISAQRALETSFSVRIKDKSIDEASYKARMAAHAALREYEILIRSKIENRVDITSDAMMDYRKNIWAIDPPKKLTAGNGEPKRRGRPRIKRSKYGKRLGRPPGRRNHKDYQPDNN